MQLDTPAAFLSLAVGRLGAAYTYRLAVAARTRNRVHPFHKARFEPSRQREHMGVFLAERLEGGSSDKLAYLGLEVGQHVPGRGSKLCISWVYHEEQSNTLRGLLAWRAARDVLV